MTYKKLSPRRLRHLPGSRRKKPPIRAQNRLLKEAISAEHALLQSLLRDASVRRALWTGSGRSYEPLCVWTDFDHSYLLTETNPQHLTEWEALSEYMKLQLGFLMAREFGGYAFTVVIPRKIETAWMTNGLAIERMVQKRCRRELEASGLNELPYAYVIEGRSRSGKSRTHLHLHGFLIAEDALIATRFKLVMERALLQYRGEIVGSSKALDLQPVYDTDTGDGRGYGRWVGYATKNVRRWDSRIAGRRLFISRNMTQIAREFWDLLRTDPFTVSQG